MNDNVKSLPTNADGSQSWHCVVCGEILNYPQPIGLQAMCTKLGGFIEEHEHLQPVAAETKPCVAEELVNTEIEVLHGRGKRRRTVKGTIQAWRYGFSVIETLKPPADGGPRLCWPSFELKIKPGDGRKAVWVGPFKDSNNPRPSEIFTHNESLPALSLDDENAQ